MKKTIFLFLITAILANCSQRITDFTIISSKNIDLSRGKELKRSTDRVSGIDKKHVIFFIPTGIPNLKEAMDRAIESSPGAVALTDGVVTAYNWWIPGIYGQHWIEVSGSPLVDPDLKKNLAR